MDTLEREIREIKIRLDQLELLVERSVLGEKQPAPRPEMSDDEVVAWLRESGHFASPHPIAIEHSERWRALSPEAQEAIQAELDALPKGVLASDIIIENRR